MTRSHELYGEWSAAYVLGALDAEDRALFESHMSECEQCQSDVASFAPIPGLLGRVELEDLDTDPVPERVLEGASAEARAELIDLNRSRGRWRGVSVAAVAVLVIFGLFSSTQGAASADPTEFAYEAETGVVGSIDAVRRSWGTQVRVDLSGLPEREIYYLWAVGEDGDVDQVASWTPSESGRSLFDGTTAMDVDKLAWLRITSGDTDDLLFAAWQVRET